MKPIVTRKYRKLYASSPTQRLMEVFYGYPEREFSLSELAKKAGVAKPHIGSLLEDLRKSGFIEIVKLSNIWRIRANRTSWLFIRAKIAYNLNSICLTGLIEYLAEKYQNPRAIVLFGSFRKGEDISSSDIDIAVETDGGNYRTERLPELDSLEKQIGRSIQIHLFSRVDVDINVFNSIANGIVLAGFLEVRP